MFHLVNSVYVNLDPYMDRSHPHFNLSEFTGHKTVITEMAEDPNPGVNQLGYSTSLDKLGLSEFKRWCRDMIRNESGRLMIWTDPENYAMLFGTQLMSIDPDMDIEEFTFLMTTIKVKFDTIRLTNRSSVEITPLKLSIKDRIADIYRVAKKYAPIMRDMLYSNNAKWSLEWRILHLIKTGECLGVRDTVLRVQRRNIIMSCLEALGEIQHLIGDRSNWEVLGCDDQTLLESDNVFQGLLAFHAVNADWLLGSTPFDTPVSLHELTDAAHEAIEIFKLAGDQHMIDRTGYHIETVEGIASGEFSTLDVVQRLFGGRIHGCRVNDIDSSKYNETMIKYFLSKME